MRIKQKITLRSLTNLIFYPNLFAGGEAEVEFAELAEAEKYAVEKISQTKDGFRKYVRALDLGDGEFRNIKRGDYIVRNAPQVEVEVKCLTPRPELRGGLSYTMKYRELKGLENMSRLTGVPVLIAIFERDGRGPKADSLKMVTLDDVLGKRTGGFYCKRRRVLTIPLAAMRDGLSLLMGGR